MGPGVGRLPVERPHPHSQPREHHQGLEVGIKLQSWLSTGNWSDGKGEQEFLGARLLCQSLVARLVALVT